MGELIARTKSNLPALSYGNAGIGSQSNLAGELLLDMSGGNAISVPYKGDPNVLVDVASGVLDFGFASASTALPLVKSGKLRALGHTGSSSIEPYHNVISISSAIKGYKFLGWFGIVSPASTNVEKNSEMNKYINTMLSRGSVQQELLSYGFTPVGGSPLGMDDRISAERSKMADLVKRRSIYANN
jgi:tripartite-type tricarboxylate transporter receptor subunit TctC